jgi:signal transduction histidine kinase
VALEPGDVDLGRGQDAAELVVEVACEPRLFAFCAGLQVGREGRELVGAVADRTAELESLSSYLQTSTEREKARLARDLHDELGGILTSAKIDIAWLEGHSKAADPEVVPRLQRLASVLDEAVDLKRRVVENLRPSLLDHLGLGAALNWHVQETCKKAGLECRIRSLPDTEAVPPEMAIAIYRMVQEGLTNTIKYAKASAIEVSLDRVGGGLRLVVADDGIGISGFRPENLSHGLAGMRQRARALRGSFEVRTAPGEGTRIQAFFPLAEQQEAGDGLGAKIRSG